MFYIFLTRIFIHKDIRAEEQKEHYAETSFKVDEHGTQFKQEIPNQTEFIEANEIPVLEQCTIPIKKEKISDRDIEFDKDCVRLTSKLEIQENAAVLSSQKIMKLTEQNMRLKCENNEWKNKVILLEEDVKEKSTQIEEKKQELKIL